MDQYLNDSKFQRRMEKIKKENEQKEKKRLLKAEKEKYSKSCHIETSKLIAVYLFGLLNAIIIYSMVAMWMFADFSYLGVLISDIAAQVLIYAIYCMKAYHAKKQSELIKFDREKLVGSLGDILDAGGECHESVPVTTGSIDIPVTYEDAVG